MTEEDQQLLRVLVHPRRVKELLALGLGGSGGEASCRVALDRQLKRLIKLGAVEKQHHGVYGLTEQGRQVLAQLGIVEVSPRWSDPHLQAFLELWPAHYQSFLRLALSVIAAKHWYLPLFPTGWPFFVIAGRTAGLKTFTGDALGKLLELPRSTCYRLLPQLAPGEVLGRHFQLKGGQRSFQPSPLFELALVVLDEWDKSEADVQKRALLFGHGEREITIEDQTIPHHATALLLLNCDWEDSLPLPEEYMRRAIVLDLRPLQRWGELGDVPATARRISAFLAKQPLRLNLSNLKPSTQPSRLSDSEFELLRNLLRPYVREERVVDYLSLEIIILGYERFTGDRLSALFGAAFDWLRIAETCQATVEGWAEKFLSQWKKSGPLPPEQHQAVALAEQQRAQLQRRQQEAEATLTRLHQEELRQPARLAVRKKHLEGRLSRISRQLQNSLRQLRKEAPEPLKEAVESAAIDIQALIAGLRKHIQQLRSTRAPENLEHWGQIVRDEERAASIVQRQWEQALAETREWKQQARALQEELKPYDRMIVELQRYLKRTVRLPRENWAKILLRLGCLKEVERRCYWRRISPPLAGPSGGGWQGAVVVALGLLSTIATNELERKQLKTSGTVEVEVQLYDEHGDPFFLQGRMVREKRRFTHAEYQQLSARGTLPLELHYYQSIDGQVYPLKHFHDREAPLRARPLLQQRLEELQRERDQVARQLPSPLLSLPSYLLR